MNDPQNPNHETDPGDPSGSKDYEVGYGRPPTETRFQPGNKGNPRGRPKVQTDLGVALREAIDRTVEVIDGGVKRKVHAADVIARKLVHDAMRGDRGAIREVMLLMKYYDSGKSPHDREARQAEFEQARVEVIAKLNGMTERARKMPGFVPLPRDI